MMMVRWMKRRMIRMMRMQGIMRVSWTTRATRIKLKTNEMIIIPRIIMDIMRGSKRKLYIVRVFIIITINLC